jgi:hypothetical protein
MWHAGAAGSMGAPGEVPRKRIDLRPGPGSCHDATDDRDAFETGSHPSIDSDPSTVFMFAPTTLLRMNEFGLLCSLSPFLTMLGGIDVSFDC